MDFTAFSPYFIQSKPGEIHWFSAIGPKFTAFAFLLVIDPNLLMFIPGSVIDLCSDQESLTMPGLVFGADGC